MQQKSEDCSLGLIQTAVFNFRIQRITLDDPERPAGLDNCTKDEVYTDCISQTRTIYRLNLTCSSHTQNQVKLWSLNAYWWRKNGLKVKCDVISEKGPYCGRNSFFLDQLFLHFCDSLFYLSKLRKEREKCFL